MWMCAARFCSRQKPSKSHPRLRCQRPSANAHTLRALLSMPALDSAHTHTQRAREGGQLRLCGEERCERRDEVRQAQQKRNCFGSPATETHWPISMFCLAQSAAPRAHLEAVTTGNPWADFHPYPLTNALHRGGLRPSVVSIMPPGGRWVGRAETGSWC